MTRSPAFPHRLLAAFLRRDALQNHPGHDLAELSDHTLRDIGIEPDQVRRRGPDPMLLRHRG